MKEAQRCHHGTFFKSFTCTSYILFRPTNFVRPGPVDMRMAAGEFSRLLVSHWRELHEKLRTQDEEIVIDGRSLSLAAVVACARSVSRDGNAAHSSPLLTVR